MSICIAKPMLLLFHFGLMFCVVLALSLISFHTAYSCSRLTRLPILSSRLLVNPHTFRIGGAQILSFLFFRLSSSTSVRVSVCIDALMCVCVNVLVVVLIVQPSVLLGNACMRFVLVECDHIVLDHPIRFATIFHVANIETV